MSATQAHGARTLVAGDGGTGLRGRVRVVQEQADKDQHGDEVAAQNLSQMPRMSAKHRAHHPQQPRNACHTTAKHQQASCTRINGHAPGKSPPHSATFTPTTCGNGAAKCAHQKLQRRRAYPEERLILSRLVGVVLALREGCRHVLRHCSGRGRGVGLRRYGGMVWWGVLNGGGWSSAVAGWTTTPSGRKFQRCR